MAQLPEITGNTKLVGRAIVIDSFGARLLGLRPPWAHNDPDRWEPYGGSFDPAKDDIRLYGLDTAIRELREERGLIAHLHPEYPDPMVLEDRPFREGISAGRRLVVGYRLMSIGEVAPETPYERVDDGWFMPHVMAAMAITAAARSELEQAGHADTLATARVLASAR